jgi:hypothetical protein
MIEKPIDYPAEMRRIARAAMKPSNPGTVIGAMDAQILFEAAAKLAMHDAKENRGA